MATLLAGAMPSAALAWQVDAARSTVSFTYQEGGAARSGAFRMIGGTLDYDSARVEGSRADMMVATGSLDLGDPLREGVLDTDPWLDSADHPYARFRLEGLEPRGGDRYAATGSLEIKGVRRPVRFDVTLRDDGREARARGGMTFDRADFRLRDAVLESFVEIGRTIRLDFDILALREPGDAP